jgi:hypothetical protein
VSFVQAAANTPSTGSWRSGVKVIGTLPGSIAKGTVVATMVGGQYPNHAHGNHAAIYLDHDIHGIRVIDQWTGQPVHHRTIRRHGGMGNASNDADAFYVVE